MKTLYQNGSHDVAVSQPKPDDIVMQHAIATELLLAKSENRKPRSSNVISIFRRETTNPLSDEEVNELLAFGFREYLKRTGDRAMNRFSAYFSKDELEVLSSLIANYVIEFKDSPERLGIAKKLNEEIVEACKE